MSTPAIPAVNDAAPVAAETPEVSVQERLDKATAPELSKWRSTGEIPAAKVKVAELAPKTSEVKEPEVPEVKPLPEDSATSKQDPAVTAADSAAATPQKKKITGEQRKEQLNTEIRELAKIAADLRKAVAEGRSVKPESQPATETAKPVEEGKTSTEPQMEDVDADGKPRFKTFKEYQTAWGKWMVEQATREALGKVTEQSTKAESAKAEQVIAENWRDRVGEARKKHDDFDSVALNPELPIKQGSVADQFILDSEHGAEVLYYLGQNPDELETILAMNPVRQARELTKLEIKLSTPEPPAPKPVSSAPRKPEPLPPPPREIGARNAAPVDEAEAALARGDTGAYMRIVNARELKARRG